MKREEVQVRRQGIVITPDISRVILKPFSPVVPASPGYATRMKGLIKRVVGLSEADTVSILDNVYAEFRSRHRCLEKVLEERYDSVKSFIPAGSKPSKAKQLLIGSYFMCEYSLEAAALFNPSIVVHRDQTGVKPGALRFIMSLRATGEGHISSIEFRTGVIDGKDQVALDEPGTYVSTPAIHPDPRYDKSAFMSKLQDEGTLNYSVKEILKSLSGEFTRTQLTTKITRFRKSHPKVNPVQRRSLDFAESLLELNYEVNFPENVPLAERAIFPVSSFESNGIEDARFVRFANENGSVTYYATYTAYNGKTIMPLLLETTDFRRFRINSLSGEAARNKGMALFPRKIGGRYATISRHDAENLYIVFSDDIYRWKKPGALIGPSRYWEFTQIGNCGSPIETEKGWLLLTHGVGPMRKYCIGAVLLDLENPAKVIGRLKTPLIAPNESEREGYVPNVVYTCGALKHKDQLVIPYATSDRATCFATVSIDELLHTMR